MAHEDTQHCSLQNGKLTITLKFYTKVYQPHSIQLLAGFIPIPQLTFQHMQIMLALGPTTSQNTTANTTDSYQLSHKIIICLVVANTVSVKILVLCAHVPPVPITQHVIT